MNQNQQLGWMIDELTMETYPFQFNPEQVSIVGGAKYANHKILYQSHSRDQWVNTETVGVSFQLRANEILRRRKNLGASTNDYHNFMWSLLYPTENGAPPIVMLVMPGVLKMRCKLTNISDKVDRWAADGSHMIAFDMQVQFKEELIGKITSAQVRKNGLRRTSSSGLGGRGVESAFSPTGRKRNR